MNAFENWFCGSSLWRFLAREKLLPWFLAGSSLGDRLLELGSGPGAMTIALAKYASRVTSLEYSQSSAAKAARRERLSAPRIVQGDAARLPFPAAAFSSVVAVLMLHHLKDAAQQEHTYSEVHRVLRPGGTFLAFELADAWLHRVAHIRSTFTPVDPRAMPVKLRAIGFASAAIDFAHGGFRLRALRAG
jgi:ubiquinone/menaquinone biosynthesis C-methylase UbiE